MFFFTWVLPLTGRRLAQFRSWAQPWRSGCCVSSFWPSQRTWWTMASAVSTERSRTRQQLLSASEPFNCSHVRDRSPSYIRNIEESQVASDLPAPGLLGADCHYGCKKHKVWISIVCCFKVVLKSVFLDAKSLIQMKLQRNGPPSQVWLKFETEAEAKHFCDVHQAGCQAVPRPISTPKPKFATSIQ